MAIFFTMPGCIVEISRNSSGRRRDEEKKKRRRRGDKNIIIQRRTEYKMKRIMKTKKNPLKERLE